MNRSTLARRYAPLAALAAVQLLIIATVPSTAPTATEVVADGGPLAAGDPGAVPLEEEVVTEEPVAGEEVVDPATGEPTAGGGTTAGGTTTRTGGGTTAGGATSGGGTAGGAAGGGAAGGGAAGGAAQTAGGPTGDTSHCVEGRQFDPAIFSYPPKCAGKFTGKNPGATYQGVTDTEVKVVVYLGKPNPQVDAILDAVGSNPPDEWEDDFRLKAFELLNEKYEFYGRKIKMETFKGTCDTVPPNYVCLRGEMRDLVRDRKPFLVLWGSILASPAFDELSALKVVNVGGQHFRNNPFSLQRRPYHYDAAIAGDVAAKQVAEFYCKRLFDKPAKYAGETGPDARSQNPPTSDLRSRKRVLGVISTDDPENLNTIKTVLKPELAKCGATVAHEFYYAQDISRAQEQRQLAIAKMRETNNGGESTSIMCFCDAVAPLFLYRTAQEQTYFPEHIVVGIGANDSDAIGQSYDAGSTLCPDCRQYENAFGLRSIPQLERFTNNQASRLYKAKGGKLPIDFDKYKGAIGEFNYYALVGTLIQGAGPNLTPANVEKGAFAQGSRGGFADINDPRINKRGFKPGNYGWNNDMDMVYWSQTAMSESMGKKGTYVQIDGRRFDIGEYPEGELNFPQAKPR